MNPRYTLALVAMILIGGAAALWWSDRQSIADPVTPSTASSADISTSSIEAAPPPEPESGYNGEYVLTVSWHPAFCETKPYLEECRDERSSDYAADHFSLHGLWPQDDEYCGVGQRIIDIDESNRWDDLPPLPVTDKTWRDLQRLMPGTQDSLERHEWALHGSCAGVSPDRYFQRAIALVEEINASNVRELLASNLGRTVSRNQIRSAFDASFGDGAGRKVRLDCEDDDGRDLVFELRINIDGPAMANVGLADLLRPARNASAGCTDGLIDRVGEQ